MAEPAMASTLAGRGRQASDAAHIIMAQTQPSPESDAPYTSIAAALRAPHRVDGGE